MSLIFFTKVLNNVYTTHIISSSNILRSFVLTATLITNNLEIYSQFLRTKSSRFTIKALLHQNEVILEPDAATILNGTIRVIRNMLDGTKRFIRFYRYGLFFIKYYHKHKHKRNKIDSVIHSDLPFPYSEHTYWRSRNVRLYVRMCVFQYVC